MMPIAVEAVRNQAQRYRRRRKCSEERESRQNQTQKWFSSVFHVESSRSFVIMQNPTQACRCENVAGHV